MDFTFLSEKCIKLKDIAMKIGKREFNIKINFQSQDEIGELGRSFNEMIENESLFSTLKTNSLKSIEPYTMDAIGEKWKHYLFKVLQD